MNPELPFRAATTRRGFLALAGALPALGALAGLPVAAAHGAAAAPPRRFFADAEREVLAQVVERIVDSGLPEAPAVRATQALDVIERIAAGLDPELSSPLPALLRAVEWAPWVVEWRFARFTALGPAEQDASLRGWMTSRFALRRLGFQALRNLSFLGYYSQDETWPLIGYAGPLLPPGRSAP